MLRKRTRPSMSRMLAVGAGMLTVGFAGTAIAQRSESPPAPISAPPRTSSHLARSARRARSGTRVVGHAEASVPAPAKQRLAAPANAHHAPASVASSPHDVAAPVQSQVTTPVQVAPAVSSQGAVVAPAQQSQSSSNKGAGLQPPAQVPGPAL